GWIERGQHGDPPGGTAEEHPGSRAKTPGDADMFRRTNRPHYGNCRRRSPGLIAGKKRYSLTANGSATIPAMLRRIIDFGVYLLVRAVIALIQALPLDVCEKIAAILPTLSCRVLATRRILVDETLTTAFPQPTAES